MKGWKTYRLDELVDVIMGQSPPGASCNTDEVGLPLLNGPTEFGSHHPIPVQYTTSPKKFAEQGDILFCVRGSTTGRMNWADQKYAIGRGIAAIRPKRGGYLKHFIKAIIENEIHSLLQMATGSTFPNISRDQLKNLEVKAPKDIEEQKAIATILSSLDDKIELNNRINKNLEAMAQAIFHQRFGKYKLGDKLPTGWKWGKLGGILSFEYGKALKASTRIAGEYPVVGSSGVIDSHSEYLVEGPGIVIGRKGTIGEVIWLERSFFPIDTTFYIQNLLESRGLYFHYFLLKAQDFKKITSDSAVPGLNRNEALKNSSLIPSTEALYEFNAAVCSMFEKILLNSEQNKALIEIRDALLPRLMSGRVDIHADVEIENA